MSKLKAAVRSLSKAGPERSGGHATKLIAMTLAASLLGAAAEPQPPTPQAIYLRCQDAVNRIPLAPYVAFTLRDETVKKGGVEQDELRIVTRTADAHSYVRTIRNLNGTPATEPDPRVETGDLTGGTNLYRISDFPLADFGLRRTHIRPGIFEASGTPEPLPSDIKEIAGVRTVYVPYEIQNLGDTAIDGNPVYHFRLKPKRDAGHNILREIWIDRDSFLPRRYVAERYVGAGVVTFRYNVTVNTDVIDGHLVNRDADGHFNVNRALILHYSGEGHWHIENVSFPKAPPEWLFDASAFPAHAAQAPDL